MELKTPQLRPPKHPKFDAIHRALLTGLLSNIATKTDTHEYQGTRGIRASIFPGSSQFDPRPKWLVAAELVETTKLYARTCAAIQPQWIERAASHLVERSYSEPRWDSQTASVIATEKVTLHGLVIIPSRIVHYGPINPRLARELFIHHALVLGDLPPQRTHAPFFRHNAQLIAEVEDLEAKIRQRNLLADIATRTTFFDARVPPQITNFAQFESWRHHAEKQNPRLLFLSKADLLRADAPEITPQNYPDRLEESSEHPGASLHLPLTYRFDPGEPNDGLTLTVPVAALNQLSPARYEWLVPGMLEEKIAALLRALPGTLRRNFVPVPTWAKSAAEALLTSASHPDQSLREALAQYLAHHTGVEIHAADFPESTLPDYLRMAFKVMDDSGKILALSRDLPQLQRKLATQAAGSFATIYDRTFNRDGLTTWDFGDLPDSLTVQRFKMTIIAYPALIDQADSCALRLFPSRDAADSAHRAGVRRLFRLEYRRDLKSLAKNIPNLGQMILHHYTLREKSAGRTVKSIELREDLLTLITDRALFATEPVPRTQADYQSLKHKAATHLFNTGDEVASLVTEILQQYHALTLVLEETANSPALSDIKEQLAYLLPPHFLLSTPYDWLQQFPRYLTSMRLRLEKLAAGGPSVQQRDAEARTLITPLWQKYLTRKHQHDAINLLDPELQTYRWLLEELRVNKFTQELGTLTPTSPRRLEKQWEKTRS